MLERNLECCGGLRRGLREWHDVEQDGLVGSSFDRQRFSVFAYVVRALYHDLISLITIYIRD
jgi:hypothetical protein